jgi:hypothetical protein
MATDIPRPFNPKSQQGRLLLDLQEAIQDNGGVECEQAADIFYPEDFRGRSKGKDFEMANMAERTAREICMRCPIIAKCLTAGLYEEFGIWGGTTPDQRKRLRREQQL